MKERMGITDMRKLANRVNFGEIEDDVNQMNIGEGLGALNAKGGASGKVRTVAVDKKTQVG
jgi:U4/U6 small nuclear ribonucleoprotein PRP31